MNQKKDIMGKILAGNDEGSGGRTRELDCLIYRREPGDPEDVPFSGPTDDAWKVSKDNVSVEVWESRAKIRMRVSLDKNRRVSMKRIASIAVDAILKELKKED